MHYSHKREARHSSIRLISQPHLCCISITSVMDNYFKSTKHANELSVCLTTAMICNRLHILLWSYNIINDGAQSFAYTMVFPICLKAFSTNSRTLWTSPVDITKSSGSSVCSISHIACKVNKQSIEYDLLGFLFPRHIMHSASLRGTTWTTVHKHCTLYSTQGSIYKGFHITFTQNSHFPNWIQC